MDMEMAELYTDYLLSNFGQATATGLSKVVNGDISHDQTSKFLNTEDMSSKELWLQVKPTIREREQEMEEDDEKQAVIIFDDTIQPKPHTDESETICWHYDHCSNRNVKGLNLLNCLYSHKDINIPISYHIVTKPNKYIDEKTGKERRKSDKTKNEHLRSMFDTACENRIKFRYVLMDSWFASKENFKHIRKKKKHVICALKSNRLIALSKTDKESKKFTRIDKANLADKQAIRGYMKDYSDEVIFVRQVFKNKDGSTGVLYLVCTDLECDGEAVMTLYQKRWSVEVFHKSLKQNACLAKSPTRVKRTQHNHVFLSIYAVFKLEKLKIKTKTNHFALRAKIWLSATQSALAELHRLRA